jgi:hypothetical protein
MAATALTVCVVTGAAVPHGNAPPAAAEPPGTLQSCPDQGRRLELIV